MTLKSSLESDQEELSLPHLIIVRRDCPSKQFKDKDLLNRVLATELFNPDIATLNMVPSGLFRPTLEEKISTAVISSK